MTNLLDEMGVEINNQRYPFVKDITVFELIELPDIEKRLHVAFYRIHEQCGELKLSDAVENYIRNKLVVKLLSLYPNIFIIPDASIKVTTAMPHLTREVCKNCID